MNDLVTRLSRRAAILVGASAAFQAGYTQVDAKVSAKRRKRRRIALTCPQCPPAPNCTLNSGNTCTCNPDGVPCVCDSCCPVTPVCPDGQTCKGDCPPTDACPEGEQCAAKDDICKGEGKECCAEGHVCVNKPDVCDEDEVCCKKDVS